MEQGGGPDDAAAVMVDMANGHGFLGLRQLIGGGALSTRPRPVEIGVLGVVRTTLDCQDPKWC